MGEVISCAGTFRKDFQTTVFAMAAAALGVVASGADARARGLRGLPQSSLHLSGFRGTFLDYIFMLLWGARFQTGVLNQVIMKTLLL